MPAGALRELLAFDRRLEVDDGYGNTESDFVEQFRCAASASAMIRGREEMVIAARLTGVQPWLVTVRYSIASVAVTTGWRARNVRTGEVYDITTVATRPKHDYIDLTCTTGRAA